MSEPPRHRRPYDSPLRRQQAAETRDRIVAAGAELLHGFPVWNWRALTIRSVAERAGVTERTVYRYFPGERDLRDAVLTRLEEEAGVDLAELRLDDLRAFTTRILRFVSSFPLEARGSTRDPTLEAAHTRQRETLTAIVAPATEGWPEADRTIAAAVLDVLWSVTSYERLVADWGLGPDEAIRAVTWVMGLVEDAVRHDHRPPPTLP